MISDFSNIFIKERDYFRQIIEREESPVLLASRLNQEMPSRIKNLQRTLTAMLEERVSKKGDEAVSTLKASIQSRYYNESMVCKLVSEYSISNWTLWKPSRFERCKIGGGGLAVLSTILATTVALRNGGVISTEESISTGFTPSATVILLAILAIISGGVALKPELLPKLMDYERKSADKHLSEYLQRVESEFKSFSQNVEIRFNSYIEQLRQENLSIK